MANKHNISVGAHDWSDDTQWSLSSGGANDTTAPGPVDKAIFDANSAGACNCDVTDVGELDMQAGFVNIITLSEDLIVAGDFSLAGGTLIADGQSYTVEGSWTQVTGGIFDQDNSAGSALRVKGSFDNISSTAGNSFDALVTIGPDGTGQTIDIRNTDFKSRFDAQFIPGNTYRLVGRLYIDAVLAAGGTYTITDDGAQRQWVTPTFNALNEIVWVTTANNRLRLGMGIFPIGTYDMAGCSLVPTISTDIPAGGNYTTTGLVEVWAGGSTRTLDIDGVLNCGELQCGSAALTTRGGAVAVTGTLDVTGDTTVYEDNGAVVNKFDVSVAQAVVLGTLTVQSSGELDANGTLQGVLINGDLLLDAAATVDLGANLTLGFGGGAVQTVLLSGATPAGVSVGKTGGSIAFTEQLTLTRPLAFFAYGDSAYSVAISSGLAHSALSLITDGSGAGLVTIRSETPGTAQFDLTVTEAYPLDTNADIGDCDLHGVEQRVDLTTGADGGNNDTTAGNRLVFGDFYVLNTNPDLRGGLGLGLGLGL